MKIDLHAHSTASDGVDPPAAVMAEAAEAGLDVIALTDHDTIAGWKAAAAALPPGVTLVRGAELSCRWHGADPPISIHLLAYLFDPADQPLMDEMARSRAERENRAGKIIELLNADGIDVTSGEVLGYALGGSVGRPHLARALIERGLVGSVDEAFAPEWLGDRYRIRKADTDVFTMIELVNAAGGVPVFAHPLASARGRVVPDRVIADMAAAGLWGLEADHFDHTPADREHLRGLASDLALQVTGSSDFHGSIRGVRLGANTTSPDAYEALIASGTAPVVQG